MCQAKEVTFVKALGEEKAWPTQKEGRTRERVAKDVAREDRQGPSLVPGLMYHVKDCAFGPKGPLDGLRKKGTLSDLHFIR